MSRIVLQSERSRSSRKTTSLQFTGERRGPNLRRMWANLCQSSPSQHSSPEGKEEEVDRFISASVEGSLSEESEEYDPFYVLPGNIDADNERETE